jgi:hypothetical protein
MGSSLEGFGGGQGGRATCTGTIGEDDNCIWSPGVGGGGGRPLPDDGGGDGDPGEGDS